MGAPPWDDGVLGARRVCGERCLRITDSPDIRVSKPARGQMLHA